MQTQITNQSDDLVPLTAASSRFGYTDARHFREAVAPRNHLTPVKVGTRWFISRLELDAAITRVVHVAASNNTQPTT